MAHKELTSKSDFDAALATKEKHVLIYAYTGEISSKAEEAAKAHADTVDAFSVDVDKYQAAKAYFKVEQTPTVILYKNGEEVKKVEGLDEEKAMELKEFLS